METQGHNRTATWRRRQKLEWCSSKPRNGKDSSNNQNFSPNVLQKPLISLFPFLTSCSPLSCIRQNYPVIHKSHHTTALDKTHLGIPITQECKAFAGPARSNMLCPTAFPSFTPPLPHARASLSLAYTLRASVLTAPAARLPFPLLFKQPVLCLDSCLYSASLPQSPYQLIWKNNPFSPHSLHLENLSMFRHCWSLRSTDPRHTPLSKSLLPFYSSIN